MWLHHAGRGVYGPEIAYAETRCCTILHTFSRENDLRKPQCPELVERFGGGSEERHLLVD
jgi:hypothetical protein